MNQFEVITKDDSKEDSSENRFNILNPRDYQRCIEELSKNENLFDLVRKGSEMTYDVTRGLRYDEFGKLIQSEHEEDVQFMLKEVQKLSEGQSTCLSATSVYANKRDTVLLCGTRVDDKFDLLTVRITQTKQLDQQKLLTCGIGALCTGVLVGIIATPVAGMIAGGSILAACSVRAIHDYQKIVPDLIYGYIFKELKEKDILHFENDRYKI